MVTVYVMVSFRGEIKVEKHMVLRKGDTPQLWDEFMSAEERGTMPSEGH